MSGKQSLSATNLAVHQHLNCDLYIHNVYNGSTLPCITAPDTGITGPSELAKAQYKRGLDWETCLYSWLDQSQLLLKVPSMPFEANSLLENIQADDRSHFFITGLTFWPPKALLAERFAAAGTEPLNFGLAKPDLLEIKRTQEGVRWRVIDAKASKFVKTSHHIQIYFYTLCLEYLLSQPFFHGAISAGVWLPPKDGFYLNLPSVNDIKSISISLLAPALDAFLFRDLSRIIALPHEQVKWHYNPLCHGCKYESECRPRAQTAGELGTMPNISIDDAKFLKDLLRISRDRTSGLSSRIEQLTDIEELHELIANPVKLENIAASSPGLVKKSKQILALPKKLRRNNGSSLSPVLEASRTNMVELIPRRNFTCPSQEDIAVVISVVHDPSSPNPGGESFCLTIYSHKATLPPVIHCPGTEFILKLAGLIRSITVLQLGDPRGCKTQFYVWSFGEQALIQSHIVNAALTSSAHDHDIRLCVGALAQGASLLQTTFQPLLLSGALLSFLAKGKRNKAEYKACLERLGLSTEGTVEVLRRRIDEAIRKLQDDPATSTQEERRKEFGQLPRIVVLKKEVERQLALPLPGYWDLPQCADILLSSAMVCPSDEHIFTAYKKVDAGDSLDDLLVRRNQCIYSVLQNLRARAVSSAGYSLLVNEAKILSAKFMDVCLEPHLRKLFFMQQFEVLAKLTELWQSRIQGCPDAPTLEYRNTVQGMHGPEHVFRLVSGNLDVPSTDKDMAFYDKLLVLDSSPSSSKEDSHDDIPVEALFDDLGVSGLVFPLNRYTKKYWEQQDSRVQRELVVADLRNVYTDRDRQETMVSLRTWGTCQVLFDEGCIYRLSPRLVDFNTTKTLSTLFEVDLLWGSAANGDDPGWENGHHNIPFLQLILDPNSFDKINMAKEYLRIENEMQKLFRDLKGLGNDIAGSLVLKASQHRAAQRILSNRLSVIWGPPGDRAISFLICGQKF
ncbi:hypothetical protein B0H34DRAFT_652731 [Crassisporium funariophilum]|nr:hypothetical protein B0H34DRAFT_652731 [Crassisporium funariophilum]